MATYWKYYPPHIELFTATLTATTGTSSTLANINEPHRLIRMDVDTVGTFSGGDGDEFAFRIDYGAGVTMPATFIALVNHNLYQETGNLFVYIDQADNSGLTTPAAALGSQTAGSGDEPIWVEEIVTGYTKRYWWVLFDEITTAGYCGACLLGSKVEPSIDPNYGSPRLVDINSGRILTNTPDGYTHKTRLHGHKYNWPVKYESISTADKTILETWLTDDDLIDTPFVFTNDGGTTFYYGELLDDISITETIAGLWNVEFSISEVIA